MSKRASLIKRLSLVHVLPALVALLVGGFVAWRLGQNYNWDLLNYHYYNAYAFIHHRLGTDIWPANLQSYNNPLLDVPFYPLLRHWKPIYTNVVIGAAQGLNAWLVYELALLFLRRLKQRTSVIYILAAGIGLAGFFGAANLSELGGTMGDSFISLFVLASLYLFCRATVIAESSSRTTLTLRLSSFALMGIAVGLKLTAGIFAVALLLAALVYGRTLRERLQAGLWHVTALIAGTLISGGFWYYQLIVTFGSPIFPFYNALFRSPYYPLTSFSDTRFIPKNLLHALAYPFLFATKQTLVSEPPFRDARFAVLCVLIAVAVVVVGIRWRHRLKSALTNNVFSLFWIFIGVSFVVWEKVFSIYRYLIPAELLVPLGIAIVWFAIIKRPKLRLTLIAVTFIVVTAYTIPINWGRSAWMPQYFGVQFPAGYQLASSIVIVAGSQPSSFIAAYLPPSARFIRIDPPGETAMTSQIRTAINTAKINHTPIFMLGSKLSADAEDSAASRFGLQRTTCGAIFSYATQVILLDTDAYRICNTNFSGE